jgi:alkanesulfonate monooxygenase SsuD/methylene tetrahydromethanopterin reductase-like flavin-dependent oxidoreductase (luciferase family)
MGLAAGDSAVHAFGMKPATGDEINAHANAVKEHAPEGLRIIVATGGVKSARKSGLATDEVVIGQGFDAGATEAITESVLDGRREAGIDRPLKRWLYVLADIWEDGDGTDDPGERVLFQSMLMSYSRQAMSATYEGKNVPEHMHPRLRDLYSRFSFEQYGDEYNAKLLEEYAEEKDFLTKRFTVAGTPDQVAHQLREGAAPTGVDAVWVGLLTPKAEQMTQLFADRVLPQLSETVEAR